MGIKHLEKYQANLYDGPMPEQVVIRKCALCDQEHTLPNREWVLLMRSGLFGKHRLYIVCKASYEAIMGGIQSEK